MKEFEAVSTSRLLNKIPSKKNAASEGGNPIYSYLKLQSTVDSAPDSKLWCMLIEAETVIKALGAN